LPLPCAPQKLFEDPRRADRGNENGRCQAPAKWESHEMSKKSTPKAAPATTPAFVIEVGAGALPIDEGPFRARVKAVIDLGIQPAMAGSTSPPRRQLAVGFELHDTTSSRVAVDAAPVMYKRFNIVFGPRAELPKLLRALLGRDPAPGEKLAPASWINRPVLCVVEHQLRTDGAQSARIASVSKCGGEGLPKASGVLIYPGDTLAALPEWAQAAITAQLTPTKAPRDTAASAYDDIDDDIPQ
jgi:hypothetical protein